MLIASWEVDIAKNEFLEVRPLAMNVGSFNSVGELVTYHEEKKIKK